MTQHELGDFKAALQNHQRALGIGIKLFGKLRSCMKALLSVTGK